MTSTKTSHRTRHPHPVRAAVAWFATLALAAGMAINSASEAHAADSMGANAYQSWGGNDYGQAELPHDLRSGLKIVRKISLGKHHGVAATSDGKLYAWGDKAHSVGLVPDYLSNLNTIDVAAGNAFNVVLGDDFNARVWGDTPYGLDSVPAAAVAANLLEVSAGHDHALAKSSAGKVYAWGNNAKGQTTIPAAVNNTTVRGIAAGNGFSLALTSGGKVIAWGDNSHGQTSVPAGLDGKKVVQIATGARHALALTSENQIVAWGSNAEGALNVPALGAGDEWLHIAAGDGFSSGVAKNSPTAGVWGSGATGIRQPPAPSGSSPVSIVAGGSTLAQGFQRLGVSAAPKITGEARVGSVLTGTHATFGPTDDVTKLPEWLKVTDGKVTTVSRELTYTPKASDVGSTLAFRSHGVHPVYAAAWDDTPQIEVKGALFDSVTKPVITGKPFVGSTLKGALTSAPAADSYRYDWYADGVYRRTSDAKGEYVVQEIDRGKKITLLGYADRTGFERINAGLSDPTAAVTSAPEFEVTSPSAMDVKPRVGLPVRAVSPVTIPQATMMSHEWLIDGKSTGVYSSRYIPAPRDAGKQLTVRVRLKGPDRSETIAASKPVAVAKATAKVGWSAKQGSKSGSKRKVTITVKVRATGVPPLGGSVTIRDGKKVIKTITLQKGTRAVTVKLTRGKKHALRVTYNGTTGVGTASLLKKLSVKK